MSWTVSRRISTLPFHVLVPLGAATGLGAGARSRGTVLGSGDLVHRGAEMIVPLQQEAGGAF